MRPNVVNQNVAKITASLQNTASSTHQPILLISIDQEGGTVNRILNKDWELTSQTKITSYDEAYKVASQRARELRGVGVNVNFSPVLDYVTHPKSFLYDRTFHGTKEEVTTFGIAMVKGYQDAGIVATIKHFPGHPDSPVDSHKDLPTSNVSKEDFQNYTTVFKDSIQQSHPYMVMTGHVLFPNIDPKYPATLSPDIIQGTLRHDIGFDGVIITDDMNMGAITKKFGVEEAAKQAVLAGNDILLYVATPEVIDRAYSALLDAVVSGEISTDRIDESVYRILKLKSVLVE